MITRSTIQEVLDLAMNAPSGANSQPWSFAMANDDTLVVTIHPEKDHPILNYKERGTIITLGALIENIRLAALAKGVGIQTGQYDSERHTISITFTEDTAVVASDYVLIQALPKRCTNRKSYHDTALNEQALTALQTAGEGESVACTLVTDANERMNIAQAFALFEQIMIEDDRLREASFGEIIWPGKNERTDGSGLYVETLELAPPQQKILGLMQRPFFAKLAKRIGLPKVIAKDTTKLYSSGPLIGLLTAPATDAGLIAAGQHFERIWLQATSLGLSLQPMTGTCFLKYFGDANPGFFSDQHKQAIEHEYTTIAKAVTVPEGHIIAMAFRIGHAEPPSKLSRKERPVIQDA